MNIGTVVVTINVTRKTSPRAEPEVMLNRTFNQEKIVTKSDGQIQFGVTATIPGVFGAYSSMGVSVSMTIPADTVGILSKEDLKKTLGEREDAVVGYMQSSVNEVCVSAGIDKVFPE